jgi:plastocyanin
MDEWKRGRGGPNASQNPNKGGGGGAHEQSGGDRRCDRGAHGRAGARNPPLAAGADSPAGAITIQTFQFQPARLEVAPGSSVTWTNNDDIEHTVTAGAPEKRTGMFNTALNGKGKTASFTFTEVGTYGFFCDRHNFMHGEIVVK